MSSTSDRLVRCVLFDLGSTLWHHTDQATWSALEAEATLRAVTTLRERLPAKALPPMADTILGSLLRKLIGAERRYWHRATGDREPDAGEITARALHTLGVAAADASIGAQVFEALRVR